MTYIIWCCSGILKGRRDRILLEGTDALDIVKNCVGKDVTKALDMSKMTIEDFGEESTLDFPRLGTVEEKTQVCIYIYICVCIILASHFQCHPIHVIYILTTTHLSPHLYYVCLPPYTHHMSPPPTSIICLSVCLPPEQDLRQEEYELYCKKHGRTAAARFRNKDKRMLRKWFNELDRDGSGEVSVMELQVRG